MEASVRTLAQQLPTERQARPTMAILGGGGYVGARLVSVLAPEPAATRVNAVCHMQRLQDGDDTNRAAGDFDYIKHAGPDVDGPKAPAYRQVIALNSRFADNRHSKGGVLYTADPRDLECADVVLVITRCGDDAAGYVQHARPGQVRSACPRRLASQPASVEHHWPACWLGQPGGWKIKVHGAKAGLETASLVTAMCTTGF